MFGAAAPEEGFDSSSDSDAPPVAQVKVPTSKKRGRGRPPKSAHAKKLKLSVATPQDDDDDEDDAGTPGGATPATAEGSRAVSSDEGEGSGQEAIPRNMRNRLRLIKGKRYRIENDEIVLDDDPQGDTKVDSAGNMLGGRVLKIHTFCSDGRSDPTKRYCLAIDAARCAGFRDSIYFLRRNPWLWKMDATKVEKDRLISEGKLHQNLRSRGVSILSARAVYKFVSSPMFLLPY